MTLSLAPQAARTYREVGTWCGHVKIPIHTQGDVAMTFVIAVFQFVAGCRCEEAKGRKEGTTIDIRPFRDLGPRGIWLEYRALVVLCIQLNEHSRSIVERSLGQTSAWRSLMRLKKVLHWREYDVQMLAVIPIPSWWWSTDSWTRLVECVPTSMADIKGCIRSLLSLSYRVFGDPSGLTHVASFAPLTNKPTNCPTKQLLDYCSYWYVCV